MPTSRGTPHFGVRFELALEADEGEGAIYVEEIFLPEETLRQRVRLHADADPEVLDDAPDAQDALPDWAKRYRLTQWKLLAREARREGVWPRKLRRWQGAPGDPI